MPIVNGKYQNPGWVNGQRPAIDAAELNAISDTLERLDEAPVLPSLTNPGTAADLLSGKQLIDANGNVVTGTIPSQAGTTIIPGTSDKTAVAAGRYTTGAVTVAGDSNLIAGNIKKGVNIFGVTGSLIGQASSVTLERDVIKYTTSFSNDYRTLTITVDSSADLSKIVCIGTMTSVYVKNVGTDGMVLINTIVLYPFISATVWGTGSTVRYDNSPSKQDYEIIPMPFMGNAAGTARVDVSGRQITYTAPAAQFKGNYSASVTIMSIK